jgi:hypothetical protein
MSLKIIIKTKNSDFYIGINEIRKGAKPELILQRMRGVNC